MSGGLRILITNNSLANRAGSELYVRDLATSLLARGHTPIAYSTWLGEVASELRTATIPVIDDLSSLAAAPDLIHGQHHIETMTALLRFPGVPAVYFCHGWLPWEEAPPLFPRILRYVAVDQPCRDRLVCEHAIKEDRIRLLLNFVDLARFKPRRALPAHPKRALIFSNSAAEQEYVAAIRGACRDAGIRLDVAGLGAGKVLAHPESALVDYDLVFAKGRSALESLAVGAAVILCDLAGIGPMVTSRGLDRLRLLNFGIRTLREPVSSKVVAERIAEYDSEDAGRVSRLIRETAGAERAIDEIERLYREVIEEFQTSVECDPVAEANAASSYLRWLSPRLKDQTSSARNWVDAQLCQQNESGGPAQESQPPSNFANRRLDRLGFTRNHFVAMAYNRVRRLLGR